MKRILIVGADGMLGSKMLSLLSQEHTVIPSTIDECDITSEGETAVMVGQAKPDIVINCAAYTAVDDAETNRELCYAVNERGAANLAKACVEQNALLFHYSTDYVFDGTKGTAYREDDPTAPINVYGASKLAGEQAIEKIGGRYCIMRITWLFGENGKNFPKTMLTLAEKHDTLTVVSDQLGSPTYTEDVVRQTELLFNTDVRGIYHTSAEGECSWYDVAVKVFQAAGKDITVKPVPASEYPTKAPRPAYSYLENARLKRTGLNHMPHWEEGIERYVRSLLE